MDRLLLLAVAVTAVFAVTPPPPPPPPNVPSVMDTCDNVLSKKCSNDPALVFLAMNQPGKCVVKNCFFKPKRGFTDHPEKKMQVQFQPSKYTKNIVYSFKSYKAEACALPNQMCYCEDEATCHCKNKKASFCKQQYKIQKGYFLVFDYKAKPYPPKKPYHPKNPYHPKPYVPPHNPPPVYYPPKYEPHYPVSPPQSEPHIYKFDPTQNQDEKPNLSDLIGNQDDNGGMYSMRHLNFGQSMGNGMFGLLSGLGGDDDDDDDKSGPKGMLKYYLLSQLMGGNKGGHTHPYPGHPGPHKPKKGKQPGHGSVFPPSMLYLILAQNKGSKSSQFLHMLPYLMGNSQQGGQLRLESLYVKIPYGCKCEEQDEHDGDISAWLKYYFFMQSYQQQQYQYPPKPYHHPDSYQHPPTPDYNDHHPHHYPAPPPDNHHDHHPYKHPDPAPPKIPIGGHGNGEMYPFPPVNDPKPPIIGYQ